MKHMCEMGVTGGLVDVTGRSGAQSAMTVTPNVGFSGSRLTFLTGFCRMFRARVRGIGQVVVAFSLDNMLQDLRFAVRQLRKSPGFAGTVILVLALGMAASVAI